MLLCVFVWQFRPLHSKGATDSTDLTLRKRLFAENCFQKGFFEGQASGIKIRANLQATTRFKRYSGRGSKFSSVANSCVANSPFCKLLAAMIKSVSLRRRNFQLRFVVFLERIAVSSFEGALGKFFTSHVTS